VHLNDARLPPTVVAGTIAVRATVTGAVYHPKTPELFVTVDSRGRCSLRDSRMAFQANGSDTSTGLAGKLLQPVGRYLLKNFQVVKLEGLYRL